MKNGDDDFTWCKASMGTVRVYQLIIFLNLVCTFQTTPAHAVCYNTIFESIDFLLIL